MTGEFALHVMPPVKRVMGPGSTSVHRARMDPSCLMALVTRPVQNPIILKRVNVSHVTTTVRHAEVSSQIGSHRAIYDFFVFVKFMALLLFCSILALLLYIFLKLFLFFLSPWFCLFG